MLVLSNYPQGDMPYFSMEVKAHIHFFYLHDIWIIYFFCLLIKNLEENIGQIHLPDW